MPTSRPAMTHLILVILLTLTAPEVTAAATPSQAKTESNNQLSSSGTAANNDRIPPPQAESLLDERLTCLFDDAVLALKQHINANQPFLLPERQGRIQRLETSSTSSDGKPPEKYKRLLEAFRVELDYGKTIETYQAELRTGKTSRLVDFLRVGQLALYYQTFDGAESGIWSSKQAKWQRLSEDYSAVITRGLRIARKQEPPQLMELPVFGIEKSESPTLPELQAIPDNAADGVESAMATKDALLSGIRENAANIKTFLQQQAPGAHYPEQMALLDKLIDSSHTPSLTEIRQSILNLLYRLDMQRRVSTFETQVFAPNGVAAQQKVLDIGGFSLIAGGRYLGYSGDGGRLIELSRQPSAEVLEMADSYSRIDAQSIAPVAIDPSGGQILQLLAQVPNFKERIAQGGVVGYLILILGCLALLLSAYRFFRLSLIGKRIRVQQQTPDFDRNNPLGRVLAALDSSTLNDEEALYLIVEDALTTEQTQLEQGLAFLKLVAAIAPMLGLLGTVTGMIETFQAIALHGSGDPKLMSGGISEALVTTVEGLVTAIPILLLHSLLSGKSQGLAAMLEAQVSVALANRLDRRQSESNRD